MATKKTWTEASVAEKVKSIIAEQLGHDDDELTPETSFEDLGADSLDLVEIVMAFEEEFNLEISDEDAAKIENVGQSMTYVYSRVPR